MNNNIDEATTNAKIKMISDIADFISNGEEHRIDEEYSLTPDERKTYTEIAEYLIGGLQYAEEQAQMQNSQNKVKKFGSIGNGYVAATLLAITTVLFGALCIAYLITGISSI